MQSVISSDSDDRGKPGQKKVPRKKDDDDSSEEDGKLSFAFILTFLSRIPMSSFQRTLKRLALTLDLRARRKPFSPVS